MSRLTDTRRGTYSEPQDEFEQAVLIAFDQSRSIPRDLHDRAMQYCEQVKSSVDAWRDCLAKLHDSQSSTRHPNITFWCLEVILSTVTSRYGMLVEEDRNLIRRSMLELVSNVFSKYPQQQFIKGKGATVMVALIREDYPARWPSFFEDALSTLDAGTEAVDMFLRTLMALEDDVIKADSALVIGVRSKAEADRAREVKDAMRVGPLGDIVAALHRVIMEYVRKQPPLAAMSLTILATYIEWMDLEYVVNSNFFPLLYELLDNPDVRENAADCLEGIVSKGMPSDKRLALFASIQVVETLTKFDFMSGSNEQWTDNSFTERMSDLLRVCSKYLVACYNDFVAPFTSGRKLSISYSSTAGMGSPSAGATVAAVFPGSTAAAAAAAQAPTTSTSPSPAPPGAFNTLSSLQDFLSTQSADVRALVAKTEELLELCMGMLYTCLRHAHFEVGYEAIEYGNDFLNLLKLNGSFIQSRAAHFQQLLEAVVNAMAYPPWYNVTLKDDRENHFDQYRAVLDKIFRNMVTVNKDATSEFVQRGLSSVIEQCEALRVAAAKDNTSNDADSGLNGTDHSSDAASRFGSASSLRDAMSRLPFAPVEVLLRVLVTLGNALTAHFMQSIDKLPLWQLIASLIASPLSYHPHPFVAESYFTCVEQFAKVVDLQPELAPSVVISFLDERGACSNSVFLRSRACYLLKCFVRKISSTTQSKLAPALGAIFERYRSVISTVLSRGLRRKRGEVSFDDSLFLCESLGLIVGRQVTGSDHFVYLQAALELAAGPLDSLVKQKDSWQQQDSEMIAKRIAQRIEALMHICKSVNIADVEPVAPLLCSAFELTIKAYESVGGVEPVRAKTITFIHSVIDILKVRALPLISMVVPHLLENASADNFAAFLQLVNQLVCKYKSQIAEFVSSLFMPIIAKALACIEELATSDPRTAGVVMEAAYGPQQQARAEIRRLYFTFLRELFANQLHGVLFSDQNLAHMLRVVETVEAGLELGSAEASNVKQAVSCVALLRMFVEAWYAHGNGTIDGGLQQHVGNNLIPKICQLSLSDKFNVRDAACMLYIRESTAFFRTTIKLMNSSYAQAFGEYLVSLFACPAMKVQELISCLGALSADDQRAVQTYRDIVASRKAKT